MPSKTFHFDANSEKVVEDLSELYLLSTALCSVLRASLAEEGYDVAWVDELIRALDLKLVRLLRPQGSRDRGDDGVAAPTFLIVPYDDPG